MPTNAFIQSGGTTSQLLQWTGGVLYTLLLLHCIHTVQSRRDRGQLVPVELVLRQHRVPQWRFGSCLRGSSAKRCLLAVWKWCWHSLIRQRPHEQGSVSRHGGTAADGLFQPTKLPSKYLLFLCYRVSGTQMKKGWAGSHHTDVLGNSGQLCQNRCGLHTYIRNTSE